jgi:predicted metalloprotease
MEWEGREESSNVEDRRGIHPGVAVGGGAGIILLILGLILGIDPGNFIGGQQQVANRSGEERQAKFTRVVLKDTETVWTEQFQKMGKRYPEPTLVLFHDQVDSACGRAGAEVGPFYCPGDSKVYIDLAFYDTLDKELGAHGEFARAYVIAHEVDHHVQRLLGYSKKVDDAHRTGSKTDANKMSVRLELQADYFAGVWAHYAQERFHYLNDKDIQSATDAAFRIGDDVLQKRARGRVTPDSFTHGTARQRQRWFMEGYKTGDVKGASRLFDLRYEEL